MGTAPVPYTYVLQLLSTAHDGHLLPTDEFKKTQSRSKDSQLTYAEVDRLLSRFKAPLHPKTLERGSIVLTTTSDINMDIGMPMQLDSLWSFDLYDLDL